MARALGVVVLLGFLVIGGALLHPVGDAPAPRPMEDPHQKGYPYAPGPADEPSLIPEIQRICTATYPRPPYVEIYEC